VANLRHGFYLILPGRPGCGRAGPGPVDDPLMKYQGIDYRVSLLVRQPSMALRIRRP